MSQAPRLKCRRHEHAAVGNCVSKYFKIFFLVILMTIIPISSLFAVQDFSDTSGHWAEMFIKKSSEFGLFQGVGNRRFDPDRNINRAEFITVMLRALGITVQEDSTPESYWATKYIRAAKKEGLISPSLDESASFCQEELSRLEMIQMLVLLVDRFQIPSILTPETPLDIETLSQNEKNDILKVMSTGIIQGTSAYTVSPFDPMTRAQLATVFVRVIEQKTMPEDPGSSQNPISSQYSPGSRFDSESSVLANLKINPYLSLILLEDRKIPFLLLDSQNTVICSPLSNLPSGTPSSVLNTGIYTEYTYDGRCFWSFKEDDGNWEAALLIEIDPKYKKMIHTLPSNDEEQEGFEKMTEFLINEFRKTKGRSDLKHDSTARQHSKEYSKQMANGNFFSHDIPNGFSFSERIDRYNLNLIAAGENIAFGQTNPFELAFSWIRSPGHRENILRTFSHSGLGISIQDLGGGQKLIATHFFFTLP